jgi:hypothetical protein
VNPLKSLLVINFKTAKSLGLEVPLSICSNQCNSPETEPRSHAPASRDGRTSVRQDQGAHWCDALPDQDASEGRRGNGAYGVRNRAAAAGLMFAGMARLR